MVVRTIGETVNRDQEPAVAPESFLGRLSSDDLAFLWDVGRPVDFPKAATLFVEGERASRVFLVLNGRAKVFSSTTVGRCVVHGIRGPGDILGEMSAVDGCPRVATATTLEPARMLVVPADAFQSAVDDRAGIASTLLRVLIERLREADVIRARFGSNDCITRIACLLLELAKKHGARDGSGGRIDLPLTQQDLADWVGASREAVTKALASLRAAGLVETGRREIVVLDVPALALRGD